MATMRLFEPTLSDPFESIFRRFMAPVRSEKSLHELAARVAVVETDGVFKVRADLSGVKISAVGSVE